MQIIQPLCRMRPDIFRFCDYCCGWSRSWRGRRRYFGSKKRQKYLGRNRYRCCYRSANWSWSWHGSGGGASRSMTASVGAVATGAGTLVSTVGTGGVSAGASFVARNISSAVGNLASTAPKVASKMQQVATKGKAGEALSGLTKNTIRIPSLTGTAHYRIRTG